MAEDEAHIDEGRRDASGEQGLPPHLPGPRLILKHLVTVPLDLRPSELTSLVLPCHWFR
jgi:hypothetical protein